MTCLSWTIDPALEPRVVMLHFGYAPQKNCAESLIIVTVALSPSCCQIVMSSCGNDQAGRGTNAFHRKPTSQRRIF